MRPKRHLRPLHRQAVRRAGRRIAVVVRRLLRATSAAAAGVAVGPGLDLLFILTLRALLYTFAPPPHQLHRLMLDLVLLTLYVYKLLVFALCAFLDAAFFATFYSQLLQLIGASLLICHWAQRFVNLSPVMSEAAVR